VNVPESHEALGVGPDRGSKFDIGDILRGIIELMYYVLIGWSRSLERLLMNWRSEPPN